MSPNVFVAENLESRTLLSTYQVSSSSDDGSADTLRAMIAAANAATDGDQYITFDSSLTDNGPVTIALNGPVLELNGSSGNITIIGPAAGNGITIDAQQNSGVFQIDGGSAEIDNLTITGGNANTGAGILNDGWLSINNCVIAGNSATGDGGGIANNGAISIANSTIIENSAGGSGGGLVNSNLADEIVDSTFSDNSALSSGGGIENQGLSLFSGCTIAENQAGAVGGGIDSSSQLLLFSSTLAANIADSGAGISVENGTATKIRNSTIANNVANEGAGGVDGEGNIDTDGSIIAGNTPADVGDQVQANGTNDLIGDGTGSFDPSNLLGTISARINPDLAPLGNYGGPTQTMPLLADSPALGAGSASTNYNGTITTDQRGFQLPADSPQDIGAFQTLPIIVNTLSGDVLGPGQMDFPDAENLSAVLSGQAIGYARTLFPGTDEPYGALWVTWPTSVTEGEDINFSVANTSELSIQYWGINYTDASGNVIYSDQLSGSDGTFSYSASSQQQITANLTAYTYGEDSYSLPAWTIGVTPAAPTGVAPVSTSATEIDLSWTDNSSIADEDMIYESTDDGLSFYPIDTVTAAAAGSANSYDATGLNSDSEYVFYVTAQSGYAESPSAGELAASTPFVAPTLDVEGSGTVVEGQPYELDVTATYPNNEPGVVSYFTANWGDGYSHNYYYTLGADPTQPLAITHIFNSGYASPTVNITAVDAVNGSWAADPQSVTVTPIAPVLTSTTASGSTLTANWTNASSISTGTAILLSTDGTNFFEYGDAAAGATSFTVSGLSLDSPYWVEALTDSINGISPSTAPRSLHTPYVAPTLDVTAPNPPIQGEPYVLNLSATYADGTPAADQIDHWLVNYGDGSGTQTYSTGVVQSPTANTAGGTDTITITAVDGNGNQISYPSQSVTYSPPDDDPITANQGEPILFAGQVDVGGESWFTVSDGGGAGLTISYRSTDTNVLSVEDSREDGNGVYEVLVKGVSYGHARIVATDSQNSVGESGEIWTGAQAVTTTPANSTEIEGGHYDSTDMPGFNFHLDCPSVTDVTVHFDTSGSTLPGSMLDWLNDGSVKIPAGETNLFKAFTVSDDGKIAPTRGAVVNIEMPGDAAMATQLTAIMLVTNTDVPILTMGAAGASSLRSDNAVIPLDPQGDSSKLTDIHMDASKVDGTIVSSTLIWNPNDFTIWPSKKIGAPGDDITNSKYVLGNLGPAYDGSNENETFTWGGAPPLDLYGQCLNGSRDWDTTGVELVVNVVKPKTDKVAAATGTANGNANGTANGPELIWNNNVVTGVVAGDVTLGEGITVQVLWAGPSSSPNAQSNVTWTVTRAVSNYLRSRNSGTVVNLPSPLVSVVPSPLPVTVHFFTMGRIHPVFQTAGASQSRGR